MKILLRLKEVIINFFSNESVKRYIISSLVTFVSAFAVAFVANFKEANTAAFSFAALGAIILVAVRIAIKAVFEGIFKK